MAKCLACPTPTAQATHAAEHPLAAMLCLAHLLEALGPVQHRARPELPNLKGRCWGLRLTCPRPAVHTYPSGQWCSVCNPHPRGPVAPPYADRSTGATLDDGTEMANAVQAALAIASIVRTHAHAYGPRDESGGSK